MKKKSLFFPVIVCFLMSAVAHMGGARAQTVLYAEDFGVPSANTLVQNYTGWQNTSVTYTGDGTCDIRSSNASSGYGQASGGGNVMINDTVKWFMISNLNTSAEQNLSLYFGLRKTTAENGGNLVVEVSSDGQQWTRLLPSDTLPTGTGTSGWHRVRYPSVPSAGNLHIRFSNRAHVDYRVDDIALVVGEETTLETTGKPAFSPAGGTYYEPQTVSISSPTPDAVIYYTLDNSTPSVGANPYIGPIAVNSSCTLKAVATHSDMYDSEVASAAFVILDTNSLVALPFDISDNSSSSHLDITNLNGFRGYHLGASYADGSVKFESNHAGEASLVAHLDSAPDTLVFELRGTPGGSNPSAYEGITFTVSLSADGQSWTPLATLFSDDISQNNFSRFSYSIPEHGARYVRWTLQTATKGNTRLNNIRITKYEGNGNGSDVAVFMPGTFSIYPNPTNSDFRLYTGKNRIRRVSLYNIFGQRVKTWTDPTAGATYELEGLPAGTYILKADTDNGTLQKKLVKY